MNFKIKSLNHFLPSFLCNNGNFKTGDFSPLIKRVLAGVIHFALRYHVCIFNLNRASRHVNTPNFKVTKAFVRA